MTRTEQKKFTFELESFAPKNHKDARAWAKIIATNVQNEIALAQSDPGRIKPASTQRYKLHLLHGACSNFLQSFESLDKKPWRKGLRDEATFALVSGQAYSIGFTDELPTEKYVSNILDQVRNLRISIGQACGQPEAKPKRGNSSRRSVKNIRKDNLASHLCVSWSAHFGSLPPQGEWSKAARALELVFEQAGLSRNGAVDAIRKHVKALNQLRRRRSVSNGG